MKLEDLLNKDYISVHDMLKINPFRDPIHTAIETLNSKELIIDFFDDYLNWLNYHRSNPKLNLEAEAILRINLILDQTDSCFINYRIWKEFICDTALNCLNLE